MEELLHNLPPAVFYIFGVSLVGVLISILYTAKKKKDARNYADTHPNVARVFPEGKLFKGTLTYHSVDGRPPVTFLHGASRGVFLLPGTHVLEVSYEWTEQGIVRTVTNTFGPSKLEVAVETAKSYQLRFDTDEKRYQFTELTAG